MYDKTARDVELSDSDGYDGSSPAQGRMSEDVRRHDRETLTAEEEAERLLGSGEKGTSIAQRFAERTESRRQRRRARRREQRVKGAGGGEKRELMYDMEGGRRSSSESSDEADMRRLKEMQARQKVRR